MTEAELDRYHRLYVLNPRLARAGVDYGDLIDDPGLLLRAPAPVAGDGLLPAQARVAERLRRDELIADAVRARQASASND